MKFTSILLLFPLLLTCQRECCDDLTESDQVWIVHYIERGDGRIYAPHEVTLQFESDSTFHLRLDGNVCRGTFQVVETTAWQTKRMGCTYKCCDSEFSVQVVAIIREAMKIEREHHRLYVISEEERVEFGKK